MANEHIKTYVRDFIRWPALDASDLVFYSHETGKFGSVQRDERGISFIGEFDEAFVYDITKENMKKRKPDTAEFEDNIYCFDKATDQYNIIRGRGQIGMAKTEVPAKVRKALEEK